MKWATVGLVAVSLAIFAGNVLGHEGSCRHVVGGCTHSHNTWTHVTCNNPGEPCTAPCGGPGTCKNVRGKWSRSCKCIQSNTITADFLTTAGWHRVEVDPPVISPGSINVFTFVDTSSFDAMTFVYGDGVTVVDTLYNGAIGQMTIAFDNVPPPISGQVLDFQLNFPSYDLFGNPTGVNHWELDPGSPGGVIYDFHTDAFVVQTDQPLVILAGNDLFPLRPAWLEFTIRDVEPGQSHFLLTGAEEITGVSPVEDESWGTIKSIYR